MNRSSYRVTLKIVISYALIALLAVLAGNLILGEIKKLTEVRNEQNDDNAKIIQIGKILTLMYESESLGRVAIQSEDNESLKEYARKNELLHKEIAVLKKQVSTKKQAELVDSVGGLVDVKIQNINILRNIRKEDNSEASIQDAIKIMANLENYMGRLTIENFVNDPDKLTSQTRKNLEEYLRILNSYIPNDTPSETDRMKMDSIIGASKDLLKKIHINTANQKKILKEKEQELMANDLSVSRQLKTMLTQLEVDVLKTAEKLNTQRNQVLEKSRNTLTVFSIIGVLVVIVFSVIILNDFWKAQQLREKLEAANRYSNSLLKSREHLISMVSHDLKTPLNTIIGYTELLSQATIPPKETNYVNHVKKASGFVAQLVDELLDYSKLEAGKIQIEKVPFELMPTLKETAYSVQSIYLRKNIELVFNIADDCQRTYNGDSYRIKQILYNLIGNAYKFTAEGTITVYANLSDDKTKLNIAIADTGIGIPKEKQQLIFEEFQQADDDTVKKFGGSGLGLHISRKLASLMNGTLLVDSVPDKGSTFTLQLPALFSETVREAKPIETTAAKLPPLTAVVIDDDDTLLQLNRELLENAGIQVHTFGSGKQALEMLPKLKYNGIITDIQLPEMNGFRFLSILQESNITKPVIAVTGRKDMPENHYIENGFAAILFKPYNPQAFVATVQAVCTNRPVPLSEKVADANETEAVTAQKANFNLRSLAGFVNNNEQALKSIIKTYVSDTRNTVEQLKLYHKENNLQGISDLSHRMLTMIRQLEIEKESELLLQLEKAKELPSEKIQELMDGFLTAITETLQQLTGYYQSKS